MHGQQKDAHSRAYSRLQQMMGSSVGKQYKTQKAIALRTGIPSLDWAMGGGLHPGLVEVYGDAGVGKTTFAAQIIRAAQEQKKTVCLLPSELYEEGRLRSLNAWSHDMILVRGITPQETLEVAVRCLEGPDRLLVVDTLSGMKGELEHEKWASVRWDFLMYAAHVVAPSSCVLIINQVRQGTSCDSSSYVRDTVSDSRKFLDLFVASMKIERREVETYDYLMEITLRTTMFGAAGGRVLLPTSKSGGIRTDVDSVALATKLGLLEQHGSWYTSTVSEEKFGPGMDKAAVDFVGSATHQQLEKKLYA